MCAFIYLLPEKATALSKERGMLLSLLQLVYEHQGNDVIPHNVRGTLVQSVLSDHI